MWNKIKQLYKRIRYRKAYDRLNHLVKYESELVITDENGNKAPELVYFDAGELVATGFNYDLDNFNLTGLTSIAKKKIIDIIQKDRLTQIKERTEHLNGSID